MNQLIQATSLCALLATASAPVEWELLEASSSAPTAAPVLTLDPAVEPTPRQLIIDGEQTFAELAEQFFAITGEVVVTPYGTEAILAHPSGRPAAAWLRRGVWVLRPCPPSRGGPVAGRA